MKKHEQAFHDPFSLNLSQHSFTPSGASRLGDRDVAPVHQALAKEKILLLCTGGIAAYKVPGLVRTLRSYGATVDVRLTERASEFIGERSLEWAVGSQGRVLSQGALSGEVEHLHDYTTYLVAPATYDFLNGMACGRADTPALTTMAAALGRVAEGRAKMLALPCMNGDMNNPILRTSVKTLSRLGVQFIAPKTSNGKLEYPGSEFVTVATARHTSKSALKGASILLTGGPTPVPIDDVRVIANIFKGKLGVEMAKELTIRGADLTFLLGGDLGVPDYLKPFTHRYRNFDEYHRSVLEHGAKGQHDMAVLSAAVADYRPQMRHEGKIASRAEKLMLGPFVPTTKVVEALHHEVPSLPIVSFKLLSRVSEKALLDEARARLNKHSRLVVANRLEDCRPDSQIVYLVRKEGTMRVEGSKREVAYAIVDLMADIHQQPRSGRGG